MEARSYLFQNQTNRLWCPISEEGEGLARKTTRGFCSKRCPAIFVKENCDCHCDCDHNGDCINENTVIIYNDGEVYTGRFSIDELDEQASLQGYPEYPIFDGSVSLYPLSDEPCIINNLNTDYDFDWDIK